MEPALIVRSRGRKRPMSDSDGHEHAQADSPSISGDDSDSEGEADFEFYEDLQLGHIPEAHYVSLRYVDWEERLYMSLKTRKDDPSSHMTNYGSMSTRELGEAIHTPSDSNEDLEASTSSLHIHRLPNEHFNFLFKYLRNGHFLETCKYYTYSLVCFPKEVREMGLYKSWGVGDRFNELESYLVTDTAETNRTFYESQEPPLVWFIAFPYDTIVSGQEYTSTNRYKRLIPDDTGCNPGYVKLKPVTNSVWKDKVRQENGTSYLKHLYLKIAEENSQPVVKHVSFKCDWPEQAIPCRDRMMRFSIDADNADCIMQTKVVDGVRVIPICSEGMNCSDPDCVEWKYSFSAIEYVFCQYIITSEARFCFKIMDHFLRFIFCDKDVLTREHGKAVFFHTCSELDIGNNEPNFAEIIFLFMRKLETFLKEGNIPNFFMHNINMIGNINADEIAWHRARIHVVNEEYLVYMFLFLDQKGLMDCFGLSKCFDGLLFDAQRSDHGKSTHLCFTSLTVMEAREWVSASNYRKAMNLIKTFTVEQCGRSDECGHYDDMELQKQVMTGLPLQEQWLYAFYLEFETGLPFVDHVCGQHGCTKLEDLFGDMMIQILRSTEGSCLGSETIRVPNDIISQEGHARFAEHFGSVVRWQIYSGEAYSAAIRFFLTENTDLILSKYSSEISQDTGTALQTTLTHMFRLYRDLYSYYSRLYRETDFYDLMDLFERVCNFQPYGVRYEWLASIWEKYGQSDRAADARMMAASLKQGQNTKETHL